MNEAQIKYMVDRFLSWRLPEHFNPDCGISFKAAFNEHTAYPMKHEPVGTNLFSADQATAMVRHMIEGISEPDTRAALPALVRDLANLTTADQLVTEMDRAGYYSAKDAPAALDAYVETAVRIIHDRVLSSPPTALAAEAAMVPVAEMEAAQTPPTAMPIRATKATPEQVEAAVNELMRRNRFYRDDIEAALNAALSVADAGDGWQPIETAPKDGTRLLLMPLFNSKYPTVGYWTSLYGGCWYAEHMGHLNSDWHPTHWRPLPAAPHPSQEQKPIAAGEEK